MLDFEQFDRIDADTLLYVGDEYMYFITHAPDGSLSVQVDAAESSDPETDDLDITRTVETYAASSLSTAVAIIERLEAGEAE